MDDITPRGPNLKLRKRYRQMIENELEFDRLENDIFFQERSSSMDFSPYSHLITPSVTKVFFALYRSK